MSDFNENYLALSAVFNKADQFVRKTFTMREGAPLSYVVDVPGTIGDLFDALEGSANMNKGEKKLVKKCFAVLKEASEFQGSSVLVVHSWGFQLHQSFAPKVAKSSKKKETKAATVKASPSPLHGDSGEHNFDKMTVEKLVEFVAQRGIKTGAKSKKGLISAIKKAA